MCDGVVDVIMECKTYGFAKLQEEQMALGAGVRDMLSKEFGIQSVAAAGFEAPGVVVAFTANPMLQNTKLMAAQGLQIAAGVPLQCDEGADYSSFRLGLFGLEKLHNVERSVATLRNAFTAIKADNTL